MHTTDGPKYRARTFLFVGLIAGLLLTPSIASALIPPAGWTLAPIPQPTSARDLIRDPHDMQRVWGAVDGSVARSDDGGQSWAIVADAFGLRRLTSLAVDPSDPMQLWAIAGTGAANVYRSTDQGVSWRILPELSDARDLAFGSDGTLFVALGVLNALAVSTDSGESFEQREVSGVPTFLALAAGSSQHLLYATEHALFRSLDGGLSVEQVLNLGGRAPVADPSSAGSVFYLPADPPRVSRDGGASWQTLTAPPFAAIQSMAVDPVRPERLFTLARDGRLAESVDGGVSWTEAGGAFPESSSVTVTSLVTTGGSDLLLASADPLGGTLERFAGGQRETIEIHGKGRFDSLSVKNDELLVVATSGLQRSTDGGTSWRPVSVDGYQLRTIAHGLGDSLWGLARVDGTNRDTVVFSPDRGASWSDRGAAFATLGVFDLLPGGTAQSARVLTASGVSPHPTVVLWRTDDSGATWQQELEISPQPPGGDEFFSIVQAPDVPGRLWLSTESAMAYKPGPDEPWRAIDGPGPFLRFVAGNGGTLYGADVFGDSWASLDGGVTWASKPTLLAEPIAVSTETALLAGESPFDNTVMISGDSGQTWNRLETPGPMQARVLGFGPRARTLWIEGARGGLFSRPIAVDEPLSLHSGWFRVEVAWRDFEGRTGTGRASVRTQDTGTFWFFGEGNLELMVKVLDGRALNDHWWVYYGAATNVELRLTVTHRITGESVDYFNPLGTFASHGDVTALRAAYPQSRAPEATPGLGIDPGSPNDSTLLLGERFRASIAWRDFDGLTGEGIAVPLTGDGSGDGDTGAFWFFGPQNLEMMVKVLDGRPVNGRFWVFFGSLSNVEFTLRIEDTATGAVKEYVNPLGTFASVGDVDAF
ncbi:MAG: hypothetical protein AAGC60_20575 [Acidobacteriota bacterium]